MTAFGLLVMVIMVPCALCALLLLVPLIVEDYRRIFLQWIKFCFISGIVSKSIRFLFYQLGKKKGFYLVSYLQYKF